MKKSKMIIALAMALTMACSGTAMADMADGPGALIGHGSPTTTTSQTAGNGSVAPPSEDMGGGVTSEQAPSEAGSSQNLYPGETGGPRPGSSGGYVTPPSGNTQSQATVTPTETQAQEQAAAQQAAAAAQQAAAQAAAEQQAAAQAAASGRYIDPSRPMIALTFDDGPDPAVGNRIMDVCAQYGAKVTFFMVGDRVASRATEVQRMVAEGHEVANHTMNHKYLQKLSAAEITAQVHNAQNAIEAACGVRPKIMRLPGGNKNSTVLASTYMPMIQWSIDTLDWKTKNAQKTINAVVGKVRDGDIVLMHELYSQSGDAAVQIIPTLINQGYQLVTVSEMAAAKGRALEVGKLYYNFR